MSPQKTNIGWADFTSNPLRYRNEAGETVWACVKKSSGCANCYAESLAKRWNRGQPFVEYQMKSLTPYLDEKEMDAIKTSKAITGKSVFMCDMTDWCGDWVPEGLIQGLYGLMTHFRPDVTFYTLTKRINRFSNIAHALRRGRSCENIIIGTSIEDMNAFHERWPRLRSLALLGWRTMVSFEPLLGPIRFPLEEFDDWPVKPWVIIGGESGPHFRPMNIEWAVDLVFNTDHRCPVYFKQASGPRPGMLANTTLDSYKQLPRMEVNPRGWKG